MRVQWHAPGGKGTDKGDSQDSFQMSLVAWNPQDFPSWQRREPKPLVRHCPNAQWGTKVSTIIAIDSQGEKRCSWLVAPWLSAVVISEPFCLLPIFNSAETIGLSFLHHHLCKPGPVPHVRSDTKTNMSETYSSSLWVHWPEKQFCRQFNPLHKEHLWGTEVED